jgi:hypothetical protein
MTKLKIIEARTNKIIEIIDCPFAIGSREFYEFINSFEDKYPCADRSNKRGYKIQEVKD